MNAQQVVFVCSDDVAAYDPPSGKDVQLEHGYFMVANDIAEALAHAHPGLSSAQQSLLWALFRKTYGFQDARYPDDKWKRKKEDIIAFSQWTEMTGIHGPRLKRLLEDLIAKNVIYRKPGNKDGFLYGFNKDVKSWAIEVFMPKAGRADRFVKQLSEEEALAQPPPKKRGPKPRSERPEGETEQRPTGGRPKGSSDKAPRQHREPNVPDELETALLDALGWDYQTITTDQRRETLHFRGRLQEYGYCVEDVQEFKRGWFKNDKRGQAGQYPVFNDLRAGMKAAKERRIRNTEMPEGFK